MPHKRAKLSTRQSDRDKRGTDLPPAGGMSLAHEVVPKSMVRVLQAEELREAYRKKRVRNNDLETKDVETAEREHKRQKKDVGQALQRPSGIKHGESLAQYNRRVEEDMRVPVAEAMQASRTTSKRARKADVQAAKAAKSAASKPKAVPPPKEEPPPITTAPAVARKTEFDRKASSKRLNDIVHAPPSFTKLPRGAAKIKPVKGVVAGRTDGVVSMAQKQMMEEEREKAIKRYRELKEARLSVA